MLYTSAISATNHCISCNAPFTLSVTDITSTTVNLQWTDSNAPAAIEWDIEVIEYGSLPTNIPTHSNIINNPFTLTGLLGATRYQYRVRARCVGEAPSAWSSPYTFSTLLPNPTPCGIGMAIPDNSCTSANEFYIEANTPIGNQLGIDVIIGEIKLIIAHPWVADMEVTLTSPSGVRVELSTDNGNSGDHYGDPSDNTCSSYAAFIAGECGTPSIETSMTPFIGKYIPEGSFEDYYDTSDPNGIWMLEICDDAGSDVGTLEFFEIEFSSNVCFRPSNFESNNVTATTVDLSWVLNGSCNEAIVKYGPSGFNPGDCTDINGNIISIPCATQQSYQITGLNESTAYDFYVRTACGNGNCSTNSCPISITTDCLTNPVSEFENFDNQTTCNSSCGTSCPIIGNWSNEISSDFDWIVFSGGTPSFNTGPDEDVSTNGNYIYIETSGSNCSGGKIANLRSGCMQVDAGSGNCHMSFQSHIFGAAVGSLMLEITTDGGLTWDNLLTKTGAQGDFWEKNYVDLSAFDGQVVQFRFLGISGVGFTGDIALDEIEFYGSTNLGAPQFTFYRDADGDGFGNSNLTKQSCNNNVPSGYVANGDDCNDQDLSIHPGAAEVNCNGQDENCNGNTDDAVFPNPGVNSTLVCQGATTTLTPTFFPQGTYYWFETPFSNTPLAVGNSFTTPILNSNKTYYLIDSTIMFPGLRITEVDLGSEDIIEIQNIGEATDYSGWSVVLSNSYTNINSVNSVIWNLGNMAANEIDFRSDDAASGVNYLGSNIIWNAGSFPNFAGWALIIDQSGNVVDALFWGWQSGSINDFDITVNGFNITGVDLPWSGNGINVSSGCNQGNTISLAGTSESNSAQDYPNCIAASIGNANSDLFLRQICSSNRVPIQVEVDDEPLLQVMSATPTICAGTPFDLSEITIFDANDAHGITSYHTGTPTDVSNFISSPIVNPLTTTTYYVRSSTATGCFDETPVTVEVNNSMIVGTNPVGTINACDGSNTTITGLTLGSGTPPYTYLWSTGETTESINAAPNPQGGIINYEVTITDSNGCFGIASMNINSYTISASIDQVVPISSCNGSDGNIILTPFGTPPYTYNWSGPSSGSSSGVMTSYNIQNLPQGSYRVTITDNQGCELIIPQTLLTIEGPAANATLISTSAITCPGANDGAIDITISGLNATATWSNGRTTEDVNNLAPGSYDVTVSDGVCNSILTGIVIEEPAPLSIALNATKSPDCVGDDSGEIEIDVNGGTPPYNFNWNNGSTSQNITNISSGSYQLTITDASECTEISANITIEEPESLEVVVDEITDISCFGNTDGSVEISIEGGAKPYTFNWSNGSNQEDPGNLNADTYQVTITDANNCEVVSNVAIVESQDLLFSMTNVVLGVGCYGEFTGAIEITTLGGVSPYTYLWSNGSNLKDQNNLSAGSYQYTVTDFKGCNFVSSPINVEQTDALNATIVEIGNITCPNRSNGFIELATSGGTAPYNYSWSNGDTTETAIDLPVGDYDLTVTDANNCTYITTVISINDDNAMSSGIIDIEQISCFGAKDGMVDVEVSGGLTPYTFQWSNGQTTEDISNAEPGIYIVTIVDAGGCINIHTTSINEPIPLQPEVIDLQHISCEGETDASIQVFTNGGIAPLNYNWSNGDTGSQATSLSAGEYDVTVTDAFGCEAVLVNIPVVEPEGIFIDVVNLETINCVGGSDGLIDITIVGGVGPFTYQWSNGNNTEDLINVGADDYSLTLTDANGCQQFIPVISLFEPQSSLNTNDINSLDVSCHDAQDGQVIVEIIGGTAPYQYNWSAGQNNISNSMSDTIFNLSANTYDVTVTDANGCILVSPDVIITEPSPVILTVDNIVNNDCINAAAGQINITTFGGQSPYTYHWSNGNPNEDQTNLTTGTYTVYVEDATGCFSTTSTIEIEQPGVNLDYNLNILEQVTCFAAADGMINVTTFGGTAPYLYQWNNGATGSVLENLSGGFYFATVSDANGCQHFIDSIEIVEANEDLEIGLLEIFSNECFGDETGSIDVQVSGGISPYTYVWNNNQFTEDIAALEEGIYNVTITDANGCVTISPNYFVDEPTPFQLNIITEGSPPNMNLGSLQVVVQGGTPPYQYQWDANANQQTMNLASDLSPGVYHVTITDNNNCTISTSGAVGLTTSLNEEVAVNTFEIFPNPAKDKINIQIELAKQHSVMIKINDIIGKNYASIHLHDTHSYNDILDISNFATGVYIVELHLSNHEIFQQKLIVIN